MKLNYLKILLNLLIFISLASCNKLKPNTFILNGTIKGNYSGFIYLHYDSKQDSCLVTNNKFRFDGTILSTTAARLGTKRRTSAMEKDFFLEESEITINIETQTKGLFAGRRDQSVGDSPWLFHRRSIYESDGMDGLVTGRSRRGSGWHLLLPSSPDGRGGAVS